MIGFDGAYQVTENTVIIKAIFPTLKNKGSKSEFISLTAAINDILKSQTIPLAVIIAPAYAAIKAIIFADITDFNQSPGEYRIPIYLLADTLYIR